MHQIGDNPVTSLVDVQYVLQGVFDPAAGLAGLALNPVVSLLAGQYGNGFLPLVCDADGKIIVSGTVSTVDVSTLDTHVQLLHTDLALLHVDNGGLANGLGANLTALGVLDLDLGTGGTIHADLAALLTGPLTANVNPTGCAPLSGVLGTGADAAQTLFTVPSDGLTRRHLRVRCSAQNALISFDGGTTWPFYLVAGEGYVPLDGLTLAPAAVVKAKNNSSGQNFTNMYACYW